MKDWQLIVILGLLIAAFLAGGFMAESYTKNDAVKAGKAEYLTTEKGTLVWRWKP